MQVVVGCVSDVVVGIMVVDIHSSSNYYYKNFNLAHCIFLHGSTCQVQWIVGNDATPFSHARATVCHNPEHEHLNTGIISHADIVHVILTLNDKHSLAATIIMHLDDSVVVYTWCCIFW